MNGRMYDPIIGRMLSPDNYVQSPYNTQSYNRYSYVLNNPLKYTDPSGEFWEIAIGIVAGAYMGGVVANDGKINPGNCDYQNIDTWKYMYMGAVAGGTVGYDMMSFERQTGTKPKLRDPHHNIDPNLLANEYGIDESKGITKQISSVGGDEVDFNYYGKWINNNTFIHFGDPEIVDLTKNITRTLYGEPLASGSLDPNYTFEAVFLAGYRLFRYLELLNNNYSNVRIPEDRINHIFSSTKPNKLPNTPSNQKLVLDIAKSRKYHVGTDQFGVKWFAKPWHNNSQLYVYVSKKGIIQGAGINRVPRMFSVERGLRIRPIR